MENDSLAGMVRWLVGIISQGMNLAGGADFDKRE